MKKFYSGFTMIELLVVISIIGIIMALSIFGLQGSQQSARDARRRSDLELIRAALELYKSDCDVYPVALPSVGQPLTGDNSTSRCVSTNSYFAAMPADPVASQRYYYSGTDNSYELCAALENGGTGICSGSCGITCNYRTVNP